MPDRADSERLGEAVRAIAPALERFYRFEGPDLAARRRAEWIAQLDTPLPEQGQGLDVVLRSLSEVLIPNGLRNGAPGFSGWITTSPTSAGVAAALAAAVAGSQRWWVQPFNYLETVGLRWLRELLGISEELQGTFTSGGSVANLVALGAARQHAFERAGIDVARDGMPNDARWGIYASSEVHHVVTRAAAVLGLGRKSIRTLPVDDRQRLRIPDLIRALDTDRNRGIRPVAIVATAGTVNTGAVDPIPELADIAAQRGIWLHVDGAYGAFAVLDDRVASLFEGMARADSVAADPHKWLAAPLGCGAVFVRDRATLGRAFTLEPAEYLEGSASAGTPQSPFDEFGELYHDFNVEQSAQSRGVTVWAILTEIGRDGLRDRVRRHLDFARHLERRVRDDPRLELVAPATLSICCFRYRERAADEAALNDLNARIAKRLRAETPYVPSTTVVGGRYALRPCYINPRATLAEVDGLADEVARIGDMEVARRPAAV
ncbi:MAG TPA: aminotransferase class V-fold PLP-dependent enzyme [Candidatus Limnocylindria bacterium]|jgi:aromatic-L-amino-acid decarboxylase|nr:aminotransferase class V-fold PLP-dependent enzyme [Candidatus Limnocylindria bacterium]